MISPTPSTARGYPQSGSLDVLFVSYGGGHIQAILPVAQALHDAGKNICIFALTTAAAVVEKSGLPYFTYADLPQAREQAVIATGQRLAAQMPANNVLPAAETQAYLGINYLDMVARLGPEETDQAWENGGRQHFFPLPTMIRVLENLAPRLIMATNSPRSEQAAIDAAGTVGIPALCLVDMFALQEVAWLKKPGFGRQLFVFDESVRQMLINHGRPAEDIVVTGNPAFDSLYDPATIAAGQRLRDDRGWGQDGRISLLYASSPEPEKHPFTGEPANPALPRDLEYHLRELIDADPQYELIIRRHPSEDQAIATGERVYASPRSDDINALVHAADVVIVIGSTVGLQGYLAGTPVLSVECSVFSKDAPFGDFGMSTAVEDFDAIAVALKEIRTGRRDVEGQRPRTAVSRILAEVEHYLH
ncbi:UDP-glycosyltransferase (plasmid) [Pseudohalocynthiibacter aestuariivivens]|uniref:Uncharacterized protein n=1 Tax=Roseovarius pelagicus TaxID=2980108 RepID=A0ABY6D5I9_9RHOB|nr:MULTISPECIES: UDP-glycosyltransferase [Rhodobacterales]QIE47922.1 UDP-glycosyltransferase [Pseudohalocynthiibacter aestuariivivens]UXX81415.1 hypothetical protein N7U68_00710 [Roseovarius pelagicus]